jgi:RHS repeat-associated protein
LLYDGRGRLRRRTEYNWNPYYSQWQWSSERRYLYDGTLVIQERDQNNTPTVTYTRGLDLSGSFQGAGGIGGLLARSHGYVSGTGAWTYHNFYQADAGGNITAMADNGSPASLVASYRYDPYGRIISQSGSLASANAYRFSSKECLATSGLYHYGFRFYDPLTQRWLNRDPLGEWGGINLYRFADNDAANRVDPLGQSALPALLYGLFEAGSTVYDAYCVYETLNDPNATNADKLWAAGGLAGGIYLLGPGNAYVKLGRKLASTTKTAGCAAKSVETELHHLLPQTKDLAPFFKRAGVNIEDYRIPLDQATHRLRPDGIHTGPSAESWNGVWRQFFDANPGASKQAILDQLAQMRKDFGI